MSQPERVTWKHMLWIKEQSGSVAILNRNPTRNKNVFWFNLVLLQEAVDKKRIYAIWDKEEHLEAKLSLQTVWKPFITVVFKNSNTKMFQLQRN